MILIISQTCVHCKVEAPVKIYGTIWHTPLLSNPSPFWTVFIVSIVPARIRKSLADADPVRNSFFFVSFMDVKLSHLHMANRGKHSVGMLSPRDFMRWILQLLTAMPSDPDLWGLETAWPTCLSGLKVDDWRGLIGCLPLWKSTHIQMQWMLFQGSGFQSLECTIYTYGRENCERSENGQIHLRITCIDLYGVYDCSWSLHFRV